MQNKNLNLLLAGQLVSQTGDKFYTLALAYMVLDTTGSAAKMGGVLVAAMLPLVVGGLFSGVIADRFSRKKIIICTDLCRGLIVALVSLLHFFDLLTLEIILLSQVLLGLNSALFNPVIPAVIPMLVEKKQLSTANAKMQFMSGCSNIAGPALGGLLVAIFGYGVVFTLNSASYFISALFEGFLKIPALTPDPGTPFRAAFKQGYRHIFANQNLLIILLMVFVIHFFYGSIQVTIPVLANLLPGNGAVNLGYLQTAFGVGAVLMALLLSYLNIAGRESRWLFTAVTLIGVLMGSIGLSGFAKPYLFNYLAQFLLVSAVVILAGTSFQSLIQKQTAVEMAGRVFGVVGSVGNLSIPFAMLVYGFLLEDLNPHMLLMLSGGMIIAVSGGSALLYRTRNPIVTG